MVLDPKATTLHNDYGSFDKPLGEDNKDKELEVAVDGTSSGMAQSSDVYQRQPLLPVVQIKNKDKWGGVGSSCDYYEDEEDDKTDGLNHICHQSTPNGSGSGIIKIDIPAPLREEPRFPKEKWKTFIGLDFLDH